MTILIWYQDFLKIITYWRLLRPVQILISCTLSKGSEKRIMFMSINQHIILFDLETELDAQSPGPFKNNDKKQKRWLVESLKSLLFY